MIDAEKIYTRGCGGNKYKETKIKMTTDLPGTMQAITQWKDVFKVLKEKRSYKHKMFDPKTGFLKLKLNTDKR